MLLLHLILPHKPPRPVHHKQYQQSAVKNLPQVGGHGVGQTDETQQFRQDDENNRSQHRTPQTGHAADDDDGNHENGFVIVIFASKHKNPPVGNEYQMLVRL